MSENGEARRDPREGKDPFRLSAVIGSPSTTGVSLRTEPLAQLVWFFGVQNHLPGIRSFA